MCKEEKKQPKPEHMPDGRHSDISLEDLCRENEAMRHEIERLSAMVEEICTALFGKDGNNGGILKQIALMVEDSHLTIQLQAKVIESIMKKLGLEKMVMSLLQIWQANEIARLSRETT